MKLNESNVRNAAFPGLNKSLVVNHHPFHSTRTKKTHPSSINCNSQPSLTSAILPFFIFLSPSLFAQRGMASPALFFVYLLISSSSFLLSTSQYLNPPPPTAPPSPPPPTTPPPDASQPTLPNPFNGVFTPVSFTNGRGYYKSMAREFLMAHNRIRALVGVTPLQWDQHLARYARRWSDRLRSNCTMEHSRGPYGENLFWGTGWDWKATDVVRNWAEEHEFYNPANNSCSPGQVCGHFTQIVWNNTERVGCARVECAGGGVIITCNYDPPGNWVGERPYEFAAPGTAA